MARVISAKTRKYIFLPGDPLPEGFEPERLMLYLPDGTPINLTADPSKMKWMGDWSSGVPYILNDVVLDNFALYIATADLIAAGDDAPSTPNTDWELMFETPQTPGYKGLWDVGTSYLAGDTVMLNGSHYGATADNLAFDPETAPGANFGGVVRGVQATEDDKVLDDVMYTKFLNSASPVNTDGYRVIVVAVDTGAAQDRNVLIHNRSNENIALRVGVFAGDPNYSSLSGITGSPSWPSGDSHSVLVKWNTFYGGPDGILHLFGDADTLGPVDITIDGNALTGPPTQNPWDLLSAA